MAVVTAAEVFTFMGTPVDQQTTQSAKITALINNAVVDLEQLWGRKIETETVTALYLQNGVNARFSGDIIYLTGKYRDIYTMTSVTEEGTALTPVTAYNDGNDYTYDAIRGMLIRDGSFWSTSTYGIKITADLGLVNKTTPATTLKDIQQLIIEIVATKSGMWRNITITGDGTIDTARQGLTQTSKDIRNKYKIMDI